MLWNLFLFFISTSMENILQSLVKIIIIGIIYKTTPADSNRLFLPPPLPYYPNGNFFIPGFIPPYQEPLPIYYRDENPTPISYQSMNSYSPPPPPSPPQLFHRNENYNPLQLTNPVSYTPPQIYPFKPDYPQTYKPQPVPQFNLKKPETQQTETPKKKPAFYATNIIIKEESNLPYYSDDYNKNYHDDDYSDNYSDETPPKPDPCALNSPYRYFEPPKPDSSNPNDHEKYTLCGSYFQPNFGSSIYTVKMPITLLPSRFPPRIEQLIERIQNYFSTYTEQETPNPLNQTLTTATPQSTSLESEEEVTTTTESVNKRNTTEENKIEESNFNQTETEVTQKTIVVVIEEKEEEAPPTVSPDVREKESETLNPVTEGVQPPQVNANQTTPTERDVNEIISTTESAVMSNRTEEVFTLKEGLLQFNVTRSNGITNQITKMADN